MLARLVNEHFLIRRAAFVVLLYMTWDAFQWAMRYAETSERSGVELGLVMAAVTAPVALLQRSIVELYNVARAAPKNKEEGGE